MNITVLGGAGKMGCIAVQNLANDQRVDSVTIADLNMGAAKTVADYIASRKIHIEKVDIKKENAVLLFLFCVSAWVFVCLSLCLFCMFLFSLFRLCTA